MDVGSTELVTVFVAEFVEVTVFVAATDSDEVGVSDAETVNVADTVLDADIVPVPVEDNEAEGVVVTVIAEVRVPLGVIVEDVVTVGKRLGETVPVRDEVRVASDVGEGEAGGRRKQGNVPVSPSFHQIFRVLLWVK